MQSPLTVARTTEGEFSFALPARPLRVPAAQDPGLSRIYLLESRPGRAPRADGLAGVRAAGLGLQGRSFASQPFPRVREGRTAGEAVSIRSFE